MRQRDKIDSHARAFRSKFSADDCVEFFEGDELRNRESPDRNGKARPEYFEFFIHPRRAIANFVRGRDAVAAAGRFAGETSAHGCEIDCRSYRRLVHGAEFVEPAEQSLARGPGERPIQNWLTNARCLSDYDHVADDRSAGDWRWNHARTTPALDEPCDVIIKRGLFARCGDHHWNI